MKPVHCTPAVSAVNWDAMVAIASRLSPARGVEEANADQGAGQVEQALEEIGPPLVAETKAAAAE